MRFFLTLLFVLALSIPAEAQQPKKVVRIGILAAPSRAYFAARIKAFQEGLRDLGYIEGLRPKGINVQPRW